MKLEVNKKYFVVAEKEYQPLIFKFLRENPSYNIKFITPNKVLDLLSFEYKEDPIPYLLKANISYKKAKEISNLLRINFDIDNEIIEDAKSHLPEDIRKYDPYGEYEIKTRNIILLEMKEDISIHNLLEIKGVEFSDFTLEDLGIKPVINSDVALPIRFYQDKFTLYFNLFAKIREKVISDENQKNLMFIHEAESDDYFVKLFSNLFDIPVFANNEITLLNCKEVQDILKEIRKQKSLDFDAKDIPELKELERQIKYYDLKSLDFDFAYMNLLEIVSSSRFISETSEKGIMFYTNYLFAPGQEIYITNFQDGDFYKVSEDDGVLSDSELLKNKLNPSYVKTALEHRLKRNFILYQNVVFLTRPLTHLSDHIYDSPLMKEFGWGKEFVKLGLSDEGVFTSKAKELYDAVSFDEAFYHERMEEYRSYDSRFNGISTNIAEGKTSWSVTNLESYINCPYKYYLNQFLPVLEQDFHSRWRGTLIHSIFERIYHKNFDFEKEFEVAKDLYIKNTLKDKQNFTGKEEMFLLLLHDSLKVFIDAYLEVFSNANIVPFDKDYERDIRFTLSDDLGTYKFYGKIDKILVTQGDSGEKYYTIIDYKSGAETFKMYECFLGKSTQLPLYLYGILNDSDERRKDATLDAKFAGFAIQHNFFKSFKDGCLSSDKEFLGKQYIINNYSFEGLYLNDKDFIMSIDPNMYGQRGKKASGDLLCGPSFVDMNGNEKLLQNFKHAEDLNKYNLTDVIQDAIKGTLDVIHKIENGEFPITPTSSKELYDEYKDDGNYSCSYCAYKDVCYRNLKRDYKTYKEEMIANFKREEDSSETEEDDEIKEVE